MPPQPHRPETLAWQIFPGSEAIRRGLLTEHQLRGSAWVRLSQDVYADARLERDHALRCRGVALRLPPAAVLAGPSAASLYGVGYAAGFADDVHVIVPVKERIGPRRGLRVHTTHLDYLDITVRDGLTLTTPARTAWDLAGWLDVVPAVVAIDGLLGRGLLDAAGLDAVLGRYSGPGSRRARRAFRLADGRAQSPPESSLRVRLVLAGFPPPVPQHPVRVPGGFVAHPDLAWPEYRVAIEYDGHWHGDPDQLHRDRRRLNQLTAAGWVVLHVTSRRLHRDFAGLVGEVAETLRARGWRGRQARRLS